MNQLLKWKVALYLAAIFAAGTVSGWVYGAKTAKQQMLQPPQPEEFARHRLRDLQRHLNLSEEQTKKVNAIFARSSGKMRELLEAHMKEVRQAVSNRNAQIFPLLTPEQRVKFEALEKQRSEPQWRSGGGHRSRRPPPPPWRDRPPTNNPVRQAGGTNCK